MVEELKDEADWTGREFPACSTIGIGKRVMANKQDGGYGQIGTDKRIELQALVDRTRLIEGDERHGCRGNFDAF